MPEFRHIALVIEEGSEGLLDEASRATDSLGEEDHVQAKQQAGEDPRRYSPRRRRGFLQ